MQPQPHAKSITVDRGPRLGEVLTEKQLGEALSRFTTDVAALRRHLVDASLLERTPTGSEYARVDPSAPVDN